MIQRNLITFHEYSTLKFCLSMFMRMSLTMRVGGIIAVLLLIGCTASDIYPSQVRDMEADKDDFLKFATKC